MSGSNKIQNSEQNEIDEALEESFPASDPPAWTAKKDHPKINASAPHQEKISLQWTRNTPDFFYESYNRDALLTFGGGETIEISNPDIYFGDSRFANAEELLIAALSFCYMHTFLAIASKQTFKIKYYTDNAVSTLGKNEEGRVYLTEIQLNPEVSFEANHPSKEQLLKLQESAHHHCFIANSLTTNVIINIRSIHI